MPVNAYFKSELASTDGHVPIRKHYDAFDLMWHHFLVNYLCFNSVQVVGVVVDARVVLQDDQGHVAAVRVDSHPCFDGTLDLADEGVYLIMILTLHQAGRVHEYLPQYRLEQSTLGDFAICQDFHRICLHLQRQKPRS